MIPHEVGLNPGGLLNSVSQVINQVTSDMNPNNYPYNVVGSIPAFQPTSKPNVTSDPLGNGRYNRFNEVEKKEREEQAEDWIAALVNEKLGAHRDGSAIMFKGIKKELFLYEYTNFVENAKNVLAATIVRKNNFECCARGSPANSSTNTATETGEPPLSITEEPLLNLSKTCKGDTRGTCD